MADALGHACLRCVKPLAPTEGVPVTLMLANTGIALFELGVICESCLPWTHFPLPLMADVRPR